MYSWVQDEIDYITVTGGLVYATNLGGFTFSSNTISNIDFYSSTAQLVYIELKFSDDTEIYSFTVEMTSNTITFMPDS